MTNRGFGTTAAVVVRATLVFAALQLILTAPVSTQPAAQVLRPWRCLTSSADAGPIFGSVAAPGCPAKPATAWPPLVKRAAEAIAPPGPPSGLAQSVSGTTVFLTWSAPSSGGASASYVVLAGSAPGLNNLANFDTGSSLTTLTVTNVSPGTYFVRIVAQNAGGTSGPSNEVVVTVAGSCASPPGAPAGLAASVSGSTVQLVWQAPAGGCAPASYVIQAGSAPGLSNLANISTGNGATSFVANNVTPGTYFVRVLAANAAGTSGASNEISLTVGGCSGPPGAPGNLAALINGSTVTLSWNAAPGSPTDYLVEAGSTPGSSNLGVFDNGAATSFTATGVAAGTYYVRVRAANACGAGPASTEIVVIVGAAPPVTVTILHTFTGPDGVVPFTALLQAADGNFYGTAGTNGPPGSRFTMPGDVYQITPAGTSAVFHQFTGPDGAFPSAPLVQTADGNFYGTTSGGSSTLGTVFRMSATGDVTLLHIFSGSPDGASPVGAGLIQASDGNFYGTTQSGGLGFGTLFRITPGGTLTLLYSFTGGADGGSPRSPLVQASDGNFYGVAQNDGASNRGTAYRLTAGGAFSLLHTFTGGADGELPVAGLIQGADGFLYGTTAGSSGSSFSGGTIFRMDLAGNFTVLHTLSAADGDSSNAALLQAIDGNFYGTANGGVTSGGTVFVMTPAGAFSVLHAFAGGAADGAEPEAPLIQGRDGNLYGTTARGGSANLGTVFRISR